MPLVALRRVGNVSVSSGSYDQRLREQGADEFVRHVLVERLGMSALVVGENFACGKGRTGTSRYLAELGQRLEFDLYPVSLRPAFDGSDLVPASSTVARQLILNGDVSGAAQVLGRRHEIEGVSGGSSRRHSSKASALIRLVNIWSWSV